MTDQMTPAGITPEDAKKAREWALRALNKPGSSTTAEKAVARVVIATVPEPRPTLADRTLDEQGECAGMQADLAQGDRVVILDGTPDHDGLVHVMERTLDVYRSSPEDVTPRPDLRRLEWPGTEKPAPAPALPDGWRLADHKEHGRVIVTSASTSPNSDGYVYILLPTADARGHDWVFCPTKRLTFLDTDQEADQ